MGHGTNPAPSFEFDLFIHGQSGEWLDHHTAPLAQDRTVCMLGLGELGRVCAKHYGIWDLMCAGGPVAKKQSPRHMLSW